jgi:hypothetical protein
MRELAAGVWHWTAPHPEWRPEEPWRTGFRRGVTREQVAAGLRPLLDRPVEHVLATHGGRCDRAALERALA